MKEVETYTAMKKGDIMLNANESYQTFSQEVLKEIQDACAMIPFNRYPDEMSSELRKAYGNFMHIPDDQLLAGNGSDEMLGLLIGYFLGKGKKLYTLEPDFSMYDYYATMHEAELVKYGCEEDGSFDISSFIEYGRQQQVDMILFSNPNNPTGHTLCNKDVCKIAEAFPNIPVIIDEAYGEFAEETMLEKLGNYQNLYVTRTLSKAFALAGARLGFLISNEQNITMLKPYMVPYNISSITQKIGAIVLAHAADFKASIQAVKQRRDALYQMVKDFKRVTMYPSSANYLYGRSPDKKALLEAFSKEGIQIRDYQAHDTFRITIGSEEETKKVLEVISTFEKEVGTS